MYTRSACVSALAALTIVCPAATSAALRVRADAPGPGHDGLTWQTAFVTIHDAVNAGVTGDEVWVAAGRYAESVAIPAGKSVSLYGGFQGTESERAKDRLPAGATVITGAGGTVVFVAADDVTVDSFTITGGSHVSNRLDGQGSGVCSIGRRTEVTHNIITGNHSVSDSGFQGDGEYAPISLAGNGGGVACSGLAARVAHNLIIGNTAAGSTVNWLGVPWLYVRQTAAGGGVALTGDDAVLLGNTITDNSLPVDMGTPPVDEWDEAICFGGGVRASGARATITANLVARNTMTAISYFNGGARLHATGYGEGEGLYVAGPNSVLASCVIADQPYDAVATHGAVTIVCNTLVGNGSAGSFGPGASVANNILAFNKYASSLEAAVSSHNLVFGDTTPLGPTDITADPLFANRAGGDYTLSGGSSCIDAGDDAAAAVVGLDMAGRRRRLGAHVDIGAYETPELVYVSDAARALAIAAGIAPASQAELTRLDVAFGGSEGRVDLADAVLLLRRANGLDE